MRRGAPVKRILGCLQSGWNRSRRGCRRLEDWSGGAEPSERCRQLFVRLAGHPQEDRVGPTRWRGGKRGGKSQPDQVTVGELPLQVVAETRLGVHERIELDLRPTVDEDRKLVADAIVDVGT